jgi:hypothetical protein
MIVAAMLLPLGVWLCIRGHYVPDDVVRPDPCRIEHCRQPSFFTDGPRSTRSPERGIERYRLLIVIAAPDRTGLAQIEYASWVGGAENAA